MSTRKILIGQKGEQTALNFLHGKGYRLYARNVQVGYGEIDIIMFDPTLKCLVFVEVKTRSKVHDYFSPASNMHYRKKQSLQRAVNQWIVEHEYEGAARTDVVYVIGDRVVDHFEGIFGDEF